MKKADFINKENLLKELIDKQVNVVAPGHIYVNGLLEKLNRFIYAVYITDESWVSFDIVNIESVEESKITLKGIKYE